VNIAFWGIDKNENVCFYQWKFIPFELKNAHVEFQKVMDQALIGLDFAKCYIDDIIVFSATMEEHI